MLWFFLGEGQISSKVGCTRAPCVTTCEMEIQLCGIPSNLLLQNIVLILNKVYQSVSANVLRLKSCSMELESAIRGDIISAIFKILTILVQILYGLYHTEYFDIGVDICDMLLYWPIFETLFCLFSLINFPGGLTTLFSYCFLGY